VVKGRGWAQPQLLWVCPGCDLNPTYPETVTPNYDSRIVFCGQKLVIFEAQKYNQILPGSAPDPDGGAYRAPPDALADGKGACWPLPNNPTSRSRPFGFALVKGKR